MTEEFTATCDQCHEEFPSESTLWANFQERHDYYRNLQLIYNTSGFHETWHCTSTCQEERITELETAITQDYGTTCTHCPNKIGEHHMTPCNICKKITCPTHTIDDKSNGHFCSTQCQETVKHCTKCNTLTPKDSPPLCTYCQNRATPPTPN